MKTKIIGTGSYLPEKIVSNDDLAASLDTSDEWIRSRTGIRQRHCADLNKNETCATMGFEAAKRALDMAELKAKDIDLIITATITADYRLPSAACLIQEMLGTNNSGAFDISAACSGSIYGLSIAHSFIKSGQYKNILLVTSETMSSIVNWQDRNTAVLFGDGASAAVLSSAAGTTGFIDINLYADGRQQKSIWIPAGGSVHPIDNQAISDQLNKVSMNGRETFKFAVRAMCDAIEQLCTKNNVAIADLAYAVPHQANLRIIEAIAERMMIPMDRFLINLDRCANTSAASLLLVLDETLRAKRLKENDIILMLAIGAGFAWGAGLYRI